MALRLESGRAGISCNALSVGGQQGTKSLPETFGSLSGWCLKEVNVQSQGPKRFCVFQTGF